MLFINEVLFPITPDTGRKLIQWSSGSVSTDIRDKIVGCKSVTDLKVLYETLQVSDKETFKMYFRQRKAEILKNRIVSEEVSDIPVSLNGHG